MTRRAELVLALGAQSKQTGQLGKNFGYAILGLIVVSGLSSRWQHGASLHAINYELHALSCTGYMRCFILCISLVIRHSKIERNIYFSA